MISALLQIGPLLWNPLATLPPSNGGTRLIDPAP
jgi:hypothetical protein